MVEIIGVKFKEAGKVYYFDPLDEKLECGDRVIVETARGVECGDVALANRMVEDDKVVSPLKPIIRVATDEDIDQIEINKQKQTEAFDICLKKIQKHNLKMRLVDVEYTFDGNKILFYFTADGRVDFRDLVKDLASVFRTRIELRQIGVRDEAKMLGGLGICGKEFCCSTFLGDFQPVSIKMAKEQGLSLNPTKISGTCGRLMCCLKYEQDVYEELIKMMPKVGAYVKIGRDGGTITNVDLFSGKITVSMDNHQEIAPRIVHYKEVRVIRDVRYSSVNDKELDELKGLEG